MLDNCLKAVKITQAENLEIVKFDVSNSKASSVSDFRQF